MGRFLHAGPIGTALPCPLVDRPEDETFWLVYPDFADVFVGSEAADDLERSREVVSGHEAGEVAARLFRIVVVIPHTRVLGLLARPGRHRVVGKSGV
jgi:hypothetical protein